MIDKSSIPVCGITRRIGARMGSVKSKRRRPGVDRKPGSNQEVTARPKSKNVKMLRIRIINPARSGDIGACILYLIDNQTPLSAAGVHRTGPKYSQLSALAEHRETRHRYNTLREFSQGPTLLRERPEIHSAREAPG